MFCVYSLPSTVIVLRIKRIPSLLQWQTIKCNTKEGHTNKKYINLHFRNPTFRNVFKETTKRSNRW